MKLAYITTILSPAKDAQSVQVDAMWKAFFGVLREEFVVLAPNVKGAPTQRYITRIWGAAALHRSLRMVYVAKIGLLLAFRKKITHVYTRDIALAAWFSLFGFTSIYEIHKPFETTWGKALFRLFSKRLSIVSISQAIVDHLREEYQLESEIFVAHDGAFPLESFDTRKLPAHKSILEKKNESKKIFLYTGGTTKGKGIEVVLEMAKLAPEHCFVLVGPSEKDLASLPKNVLALGRFAHGDVGTFYQFADALLLPNTKQLKYWKYTSPLKLFEYMSTGIPMIASTVGSIGEVLDDRFAYTFDPEDPSSMKRAISAFLKDPNEAKKRALAAKKEFLRSYSWDIRATHIIQFLQSYEKHTHKK